MIPLHDDQPTSIFPTVTVALIVLCSVVFLWQLSLSPQAQTAVVFGFGMIPAVLFHEVSLAPNLDFIPAPLTVISSQFLHGGWMHLIGNMLYLWIFGNNVEDAMGHWRYIAFYLLCGIAAALTQALMAPTSQLPMIGASGAISGVLGAYLLLHPRARVLVAIPLGILLPAVRLPAVAVLGFWFVLQLISSLVASTEQGGVAWGAHVGGFVVGMLLIPIFKYRRIRLLH
jgi:membrane associated rhomboid family serine protease